MEEIKTDIATRLSALERKMERKFICVPFYENILKSNFICLPHLVNLFIVFLKLQYVCLVALSSLIKIEIQRTKDMILVDILNMI